MSRTGTRSRQASGSSSQTSCSSTAANTASVAKINGYDLITKQQLKYRTTAKRVISQLIEIHELAGVDDTGKLKSHVKVLVGTYKSENGIGLELQDAD